MNEKAFLTKLFWMALAIFVLFYSLIALVDPYQQFGFNQFNRDSMPAERIEKAQLLEKNNNEYEFFIIGSSVANNFEPAIIEKLTGYKTFNFSLVGLHLEEYFALFNLISQTQKAKIIYIHQDFWVFNKNQRMHNRVHLTPIGKYLSPHIERPSRPFFIEKSYLSLASFLDALKLIKRWKTGSSKNELDITPISLSNNPNKKVWFRKDYFKHGYYDKYLFDEERARKWLGRIKKIADDNNIKIIVGIPPINKQHLEKFQSYQNLKIILPRVKKMITDVFGGFHDFHNCSVLAFRGPYYWEDSIHPTKKLAEIMTRIILDKPVHNNVPKLFGKKITDKNVSKYLINSPDFCI